MTPATKRKLLARIGAGMDGDSACAELGIPVSEIANASPRFAALIDEAVRAGSARLRGRLFKNALRDDDTKYLQDLLDKRAQVGAETITEIRRIVFFSNCEVCGAAQSKPGAAIAGERKPRVMAVH